MTTLADPLAPFLPDQPTHDLARIGWIDVRHENGTTGRVGLTEALVDAHTLTLDDARQGPLWRHATHRLLIGMTCLVRAHTPDHDWDAVAAGTAPLPAAGVTAVLERLADLLWLHHPTTPFLQRTDVARLMSARKRRKKDNDLDWMVANTDPFWALLPDVPAKSNTAWFGRADQRRRPDVADAAAALLVRHYFALPGNEAPNTVAKSKRSEGASTGLTNRGRSYATNVGPTLAATLARNLLADTVDQTRAAQPVFLEDPDGHGAALATTDRLWLYTASCAATLLVPGGPDRFRVVRTPQPWPRATAKAVSAACADTDQHGLRVAPRSPGPTSSAMSLPADGSDLDLVRTYYRSRLDGGRTDQEGLLGPTVLDRAQLAHPGGGANDAEVLVIDGAGSGTGPRIRSVAVLRPPAGSLQADRLRASWYVAQADRIVGGAGAAATKVGTAVLRATVAGDLPPATRTQVYDRCRRRLTDACEAVLADLLDTALTAPIEQLPVGLTATQTAAITDAAMGLYDELVAVHVHRPAAIPRIVRQRSYLPRTLQSSLT